MRVKHAFPPGLIAGGLVAAAILVGAGPAGATTCAPHPDARPIAIVRGEERLSTGDAFFDRYDLAIAGTVRSVRTDRRPASPTYGRTRVRVAMLAAFGENAIAPVVVVPQSDPGWLNGHFFTRGRTYFIPLKRDTRGRFENLFVCDPLTEIAPSAVPDLVAAARPGLAVATGPALVRSGLLPADGGGRRGWAIAGGLALVAAAAAMTAAGLRGRPPG